MVKGLGRKGTACGNDPDLRADEPNWCVLLLRNGQALTRVVRFTRAAAERWANHYNLRNLYRHQGFPGGMEAVVAHLDEAGTVSQFGRRATAPSPRPRRQRCAQGGDEGGCGG